VVKGGHRHSVGRSRIVTSDKGTDVFEVFKGCIGEPYLHRGRGNSFFDPQDNNQRRTSSYGEVLPELTSARAFSIAST